MSNILLFLQQITQFACKRYVVDAEAHYKVLNCRLMAEFCQFHEAIDHSFVFDAVMQTQKKLLEIGPDVGQELKVQIQNVETVLKETNLKCLNRWSQQCESEKQDSLVPDVLNFTEADKIINVKPELEQYFEATKKIEISCSSQLVNDLQIPD